MSEDDVKEIDGVKEGHTSLRMGKAFLREMPGEKDHYALYRKMVSITNDKGKIVRRESDGEVGPLVIFRKAGKGDRIDLRTVHPVSAQPIDLMEVWRPDENS